MKLGGNDRIARLALLVFVLGVAAVAIASATLGANDAGDSASMEAPKTATAGRPALALADVTPIRLRGTRFEAGERVRVTVGDGSASRRKVVTASRAGAFVVTFTGVGSCTLTASAVGDRGSRASFQLSSFRC